MVYENSKGTLKVQQLNFLFFYILFYFLTLQYCIGFATYQHEFSIYHEARFFPHYLGMDDFPSSV